MKSLRLLTALALVFGSLPPAPACGHEKPVQAPAVDKSLVLDFNTPVDPALQKWLENLDLSLRTELGMTEKDSAAGILDLRTGRLALVRPDRIEYAASVAKIGILFAWFDLHREAPGRMDPGIERELGEMAKISSNEMAAKYSREIGLKKVQEILTREGFYDAAHGGGLWVGRHYGKSDERYGDPLADHSHAATVRQVLRFFLLMEQGRLVSPEASAEMRRIFDSPELPHDNIKFVKALSGNQDLHIRRKWGTWEDWRHDAAAVSGPGRNYLIVGLTHHPRGDEYLEKFAAAADAHLAPTAARADPNSPAVPSSPPAQPQGSASFRPGL
ncbi:MAG: serine hydrolase [Verrucomicrobiota bacterium]